MASLVRLLKALADPVRLRILGFLRSPVHSSCSRPNSVCACDLENNLGLAQPTISHHMKILVDAGLVSAEKQGRWVYYELRRAALDEVLESLRQYRPEGPLPEKMSERRANAEHGGL